MSEPLKVDSGVAFSTGQTVMAHAVELREELGRLGHEWDDLSEGWSGEAASAYEAAWQDWHEGALNLTGSLLDSSEKLCRGAVAYEQQDEGAADAVDAASSRIEP